MTYSADSSGTLLSQIQEGFACDIFFSAGKSQVTTLEEDGLVVEGTTQDLLQNQLCLVTGGWTCCRTRWHSLLTRTPAPL